MAQVTVKKLSLRSQDGNNRDVMISSLAKLIISKPKGERGLHTGLKLLTIALIQFTWGTILAQQTHVLLEDRKVLVTRIDLSPGERYSVPKDESEAVWIILDPALLATKNDGLLSSKQVQPGDAEVVGGDEELVFQGTIGQRVRLIFVKPKGSHQELTVDRFLADGSLEDASRRNITLLVAVAACRFGDIWNLGKESEWIPSKPIIVSMKAGSVRWIRPGTHHFKNLGSTAAKFVSIEL